MKTPKRTQKRKCRDPQSNALFQVYFNTNIELLSKTIGSPDGTATSLESVLVKPPFTNIVYAAPATMTLWHAARCAATHIQDWAQRYNLCLIPDPPSDAPSSNEETSGESESNETDDSTDSADSSDSDSSSKKKRSSPSLVLCFWLQRLTHNDISIVPNPRKGTLCEVRSIWEYKPEGAHYQWRVHSQKRVRCYSDEPPVPPSNPNPDEATGTGAGQAAVKVTDTRSDDATGSVEASGAGTHTATGTESVEAGGTGTHTATVTESVEAGGTGTHAATATAAATGSDTATGTGSNEGTQIVSSAASVAMPVTSSNPTNPVPVMDSVAVAPTDQVVPTDQVASSSTKQVESFGSDVTSTATTNILRLLKSARV